jgi:hypothetical protein
MKHEKMSMNICAVIIGQEGDEKAKFNVDYFNLDYKNVLEIEGALLEMLQKLKEIGEAKMPVHCKKK